MNKPYILVPGGELNMNQWPQIRALEHPLCMVPETAEKFAFYFTADGSTYLQVYRDL